MVKTEEVLDLREVLELGEVLELFQFGSVLVWSIFIYCI